MLRFVVRTNIVFFFQLNNKLWPLLDEGSKDVCDFFWAKLQKDFPLAITIEDPDLPSSTERITNINIIDSKTKKDKQDEWHLPVHWFKRPYFHFYILESTGNESGTCHNNLNQLEFFLIFTPNKSTKIRQT